MKIAIIPARGGSKRIPRKNIRLFAGKPIIAWPITAAIKSNIFDRVIVSTDDKEIQSIAEEYGAEVPFLRPPALANDHAITNDVMKHAIEWVHTHDAKVTHACCLYATTPFVKAEHIQEGLHKLVSSKTKYAFTICEFPSVVQRALRINRLGHVEPIWPKNTKKRTQDLEKCYFDAGQFYWGTAEAFLNDVPVHSTESIPIILPRELAHDIDTFEDWAQAELAFKALNS